MPPNSLQEPPTTDSNPNSQARYDFIMQADNKPKRTLLPSGGNSLKSRIILVVVGASVLAIIGALFYTFVFAGAPSNQEQLLRVAQQQNELIRVADIGVKKARGIEAKHLATTTKLSLTTDQAALVATLKSQKVKTDTKTLGTSKNTQTDDQLTKAEQSNRFDEVFLEYLQKELVSYQQNLRETYRTTTNQRLKATLNTQYKNASILIGVKPEE